MMVIVIIMALAEAIGPLAAVFMPARLGVAITGAFGPLAAVFTRARLGVVAVVLTVGLLVAAARRSDLRAAAAETSSSRPRQSVRRRFEKKTKRLRRRARRVVELVTALENLGALRAEVDEATSRPLVREKVQNFAARARAFKAARLPAAWRQRLGAKRRSMRPSRP